ncbi:Kelch repeat-containing protein [Pseudoalteromonas sp. G4]|uniref:Kelch repeat-containing protein n=1 Tax=Pseudoalteromonas sp. G4 TaxID=2992761 RepID=UPI00237D9C04|nr:kelch repeat-containing protein [Pseudoalteromonas sp. G4]MDE3271846.1 hypothetical protein [Pseudoalteromonas sp. G4]
MGLFSNKIFSFGFVSLLLVNTSQLMAGDKELNWYNEVDLPIAMQEIYPVTFNQRIVVGGGFVPSDSPSFKNVAPSTAVFLLNPARQRWRQLPELPEARHHLGMISNQHYLYGIGGFTGNKDSAWQIQNSVFRIDGNLQRWRNGPKLPIPLAESSYASIGKNVHIIGGRTVSNESGGNIDTNAHYILVNNAYWRKARPASILRSSAASAVIGNQIYVIGGRSYSPELKNLSYAEVYDVNTDSWSPIAPLPISAAGLAATVYNGKLIVSGGEAFTKQKGELVGETFDIVWQYDPNSDQWQNIGTLPTPRHGHGSVTFNEQMYIIGGAAKAGAQETLSSVIKLRK